MRKISLNGIWHGKCIDKPEIQFDGVVPGSVLNDLIENNFTCQNVFYRDNAESVQKYENYNWVYSKTFEVGDLSDDMLLVFGRLDTYCDIYLNGSHLGYCDNGFIPHRFRVENIIKAGENTIEIYFYSPIKKVEGKKALTGAFTTERMYTRRTQCTYGWDWNMRFVTCGIGDDVYLQYKDDRLVIRDSYIYTRSIDEDSAQIGIDINFEKSLGGLLTFEIYSDNGALVKSFSRYCDEEFVSLTVDIEQPLLWFPLGYGKQNLYRFIVRCGQKSLYDEKFGIRTVKITELADEKGGESYRKCTELKKSKFARVYDENVSFSCFTLKVNGVKVMCKGANWVPCEPFKNGKEKEKISKLLALAKEAGVNMLRVWGGGAFECEHFYDECSRLGIMVTQDFLMACGEYPENEEWFKKHLKAEAQYVSIFLRNKPCLMWWSGDNENAIGGRETDEKYLGRTAACHVIAPIVHRNDPYRRFFASSPYGGSKYGSQTVGTTHNTQFLADIFEKLESDDLSDYKGFFKQFRARFIAEEPTMGSIQTASLKKFLNKDDIYGEDLSMMRYHTKSNPFLEKTLFEYTYEFAQKLLGEFLNGTDRCFKLKYIQYEWVRITMEQARREKWFCSGLIYWMFNDCWPAASGWAFVDYYCVPKASYYSFKRCSAPVICSVDRQDDKYVIYGCNDTLNDASGVMKVYRFDNTDAYRKCEELKVRITKNSSQKVAVLPVYDNEFIVAEFEYDGGKDVTFYKEGGLRLKKTDIDYTVSENKITVKADKYIHSLAIDGDIIAEDNYFSMLPNEERSVGYNGAGEIIIEAYSLEGE